MTLTPRKRTATSARRTLCVTLLGVLVLVGASAPTPCSLRAARRTSRSRRRRRARRSSPGQASHLHRDGHARERVHGAVTLTAGQPAGRRHRELEARDGSEIERRAAQPEQRDAHRPDRRRALRNGTSQPLITATSGKLTSTTNVTLAVQPAAQPNFTLTASPASSTIVQGDQAAYASTSTRTGGFSGVRRADRHRAFPRGDRSDPAARLDRPESPSDPDRREHPGGHLRAHDHRHRDDQRLHRHAIRHGDR